MSPISRSSTSGARDGRRLGLVSTYPPEQCGLATFSAALVGELVAAGDQVDVVRIDDGGPAPASTRFDLVNGSSRSVAAAARVLSQSEVAIVQHEYGIYGGDDGDEVITLLEKLTVPSIVTLHTVPLVPSVHQREVLEQIGALADRLVVMSTSARERLLELYSIDRRIVVTIPHGASAPQSGGSVDQLFGAPSPQLLTWGLIGPGKGIEHVIDALAILAERDVRPSYTIAGVTHPKVLAHSGDAYRTSLVARADGQGLAEQVTFDGTYRTVDQLMRFVASAQVVVLPYDSVDQVTSGVLVDSVEAGRPVIATSFPHAVEMLADGLGIIVAHRDPAALADAIEAVLTDPSLADSMSERASALAPSLHWSTIAEQYRALVDEVAGAQRLIAI